MNVPHQDESVSLLAAKRVAAPASTWVRKAIAGTVLVAGCAVAAVAYAQAGASANTHAVLGAGAPHRLSPRQRAMRHYVASKRRYRVEGERSTLGQTTALAQQAAEFDSLTPDQQFAEVGDGGVDGSDFHHMNVYHVYPGVEGCETTCEGESVTKEQCDSMFFCEYDVGKCWSGVGRYPCPANEQELYDIWDDHYDDYETGMHHDLDAFPDYVYPGTYGCEATCEHVEMSQAQCDSMFYCEWDKDRCWSRVGPNDCPATEKAMHDLWYEYEYKNEKVDGIPATPTPSPVPVYTAVPTPLPQIHVHATPMPTPVVEASSWTNADGSTVSKNADGSTTTTGADGTVVSTDAAGVTTITATDGTTTVTGTDGTLTTSTTANAAPTATATPAWTPTYKPGDVSDASTIHEVTLDGGVTTTSLTPTATHTPTPLNVVTEANGVVVATNDGADVEAAQAEAEKAAAALPAGVQAQNLDLDGDDSTAPVVTETNVGVVVVDGSMVSTNDGVENSDTEHHHHLKFPHSYPGITGCEATCEGHGFTQNECDALFFCEWDDGACFSAVGSNPCPNTPEEMSLRWLDYDADASTSTPSDVTERLEIEEKQFHNPTYHHPTIPGAWVGYPGTDGCENVCESEAIDEATCGNMFFCVWDQDKCWSGVGPNNCPDTQEELDEMMNRKK
jgi:hypothetical protein